MASDVREVEASQSVSQLLARVLGQLSLSAWLPSAALVLGTAFIVEYADAVASSTGPRQAISMTLGAAGDVKLGGLVLLVFAITVCTMVTQAFAFGAIRVLEGYWGPSRPLDRAAEWAANRMRRRRQVLLQRHDDLTAEAFTRWLDTQDLDEDAVLLLRANVLAEPLPTSRPALTPETLELVGSIDWRADADPNLRRRELALEKRLDDFPAADGSVLPTLLGNIMRRHEDATGLDEVEDLVEKHFDQLPFSLQVTHDEQRTRLDLYCCMCFVSVVLGVLGVSALAALSWEQASVAAALGCVAVWVSYRASISTARHYGSILVLISQHIARARSEERSSRDHLWLV